MIRTLRGALYTGISTDVIRRFRQHQRGTGSRALRGKGPLELVLCCVVGNHTRALQLEYQIKQLSRVQKLQLVAEQPITLSTWISQNGQSNKKTRPAP